MTVYPTTSRYVLDDGGRTASPKGSRTSRYVTFQVRAGDTLENIAARYLGDPNRYWEIADINPQIKFPLDLTVGMVLRLPT